MGTVTGVDPDAVVLSPELRMRHDSASGVPSGTCDGATATSTCRSANGDVSVIATGGSSVLFARVSGSVTCASASVMTETYHVPVSANGSAATIAVAV